MMSCSGLHSYADLAMAMLTSISALSEEYKREDLAEKLHSNLKRSLLSNRRLYVYILLHKLLKLLGSKGAKIYISLNQFLIQTDYYR